MQREFELEVGGSTTVTTFDQIKEVLPLRGDYVADNIASYLEAAILEGSITACHMMVHYMWQTTVDKQDYVHEMFLLTYSASKCGLLACVSYLVSEVRFTPIQCSGLITVAYRDKDLTAACTLYKSFSKDLKDRLPDDATFRECLKWMNTAPRQGVQL